MVILKKELLKVEQTKRFNLEGPEGVKWELGFAHFLAGKMGFHALGLGFINKKTIENGNGIKI